MGGARIVEERVLGGEEGSVCGWTQGKVAYLIFGLVLEFKQYTHESAIFGEQDLSEVGDSAEYSE
jgi:hypothetical protein